MEGPDLGAFLDRETGTILVGSGAGVDLPLTDPCVSRAHAELRLFPEGVLALDLDSRNGLIFQSTRQKSAFLRPGDFLKVGKTKLSLTAADEGETKVEVSPSDHPRADCFGEFVTCAPQMGKILRQLRQVAKSDATVLLEGETGTGKELLARALHSESPRRQGPLAIFDGGSVTASLLESHLFGHRRGAFTGATEDQKGVLEAGDGGTVFLDEIGELSIELQPKLLRAIESRTLRRLGDVTPRSFDCRFVAATHRDLSAMIQQGHFREDLYYRLAVVRIRIPPLRARPEDIPLLAALYATKLSGGRTRLLPATISALTGYDWPGNARELRNVIERALSLTSGGDLEPDQLFPDAASGPEQTFQDAKNALLADFERRYAEGLMARHAGNLSAAARNAGLSRNALYGLLRRVGLPLSGRDRLDR